MNSRIEIVCDCLSFRILFNAASHVLHLFQADCEYGIRRNAKFEQPEYFICPAHDVSMTMLIYVFVHL